MSQTTLFIGFIVLAIGLTFMAVKVRMILFRLAAALGWTGLGIYLLIGNNSALDISDTWIQVMGFIFLVMAIAVLLLQIKTDTQHERSVRGKDGSVHKEQWRSWDTVKKSKGPSAAERQLAYRSEVRARVNRGRARSKTTSTRRT
jgi:uncharacterized membrane protein